MFLFSFLLGDVTLPETFFRKFAPGSPPIFRCYVPAWGPMSSLELLLFFFKVELGRFETKGEW